MHHVHGHACCILLVAVYIGFLHHLDKKPESSPSSNVEASTVESGIEEIPKKRRRGRPTKAESLAKSVFDLLLITKCFV